MVDGESNFISTQASNLIYYKTKPNWAQGDLHNNRREGSLVARHLVSSQQSEPITKGWNNGIAMSSHKPSNSQLQSTWTARLYCILYFPASFKMSGTTPPMAEQHILEYLNHLISISFGKRHCTLSVHLIQISTKISYLYYLHLAFKIWMKCILVKMIHISIYSATVSHRYTV